MSSSQQEIRKAYVGEEGGIVGVAALSQHGDVLVVLLSHGQQVLCQGNLLADDRILKLLQGCLQPGLGLLQALSIWGIPAPCVRVWPRCSGACLGPETIP